LFPEICNLSGDGMNIRYLHQCCPALEVIETSLQDKPAFLDGSVDLVYLGTATEKGLQLIVEALRPVREEMVRRIDEGQLMLVTGNALDALGNYVESDDGLRFDGLGILDTHAEYHMMQRHNSFFLGQFEGMDIVGFKSLFGHTYANGIPEPLFSVERGVGRQPGAQVEGFRRGNLLATYLTGPLLVLNPPFTKWLLRQMGAPDTLAFEEAAMDNYNKRVAEFREEGRSYLYH
jgi:CobQ-like glutamine amidotransferase family enzyme